MNPSPKSDYSPKPLQDHHGEMMRLLETVSTLTKRVQCLEGEVACLVAVINDNNRADRPRLII
jgi:hypothetical protein